MKSFLKKNWKKLAGLACGVAVVVVTPINPPAGAALGVVCGAVFTHDYHAGRAVAQIVKDNLESGGKRP